MTFNSNKSQMKQKTNTRILFDYILLNSSLCSDKEFRLTVYLLSILAQLDTFSYVIYMNELLDGVDWIDDYKKIEKYNPVSIKEEEIIKLVEQINKKGILKIKTIEGSNYSFYITLITKKLI